MLNQLDHQSNNSLYSDKEATTKLKNAYLPMSCKNQLSQLFFLFPLHLILVYNMSLEKYYSFTIMFLSSFWALL